MGSQQLLYNEEDATQDVRNQNRDSKKQLSKKPETEVQVVEPEFAIRTVVGRVPYNKENSPVSNLSMSITPGEEFEILENFYVSGKFDDSNKWVLARRVGADHSAAPLRIPLKNCALKGTMEANPWYFGKMSRQDAVLTLRQNNYPKGAFLVRDNTTNPDNYSISVVSKPGDDHKRKASIKHYKIQKK